jgi:hypothetical protein
VGGKCRISHVRLRKVSCALSWWQWFSMCDYCVYTCCVDMANGAIGVNVKGFVYSTKCTFVKLPSRLYQGLSPPCEPNMLLPNSTLSCQTVLLYHINHCSSASPASPVPPPHHPSAPLHTPAALHPEARNLWPADSPTALLSADSSVPA